MTRVTERVCAHYPMPRRRGQRVTGHWQRITRVSPHVEVAVRYPTFTPPPRPAPAQPVGGYRASWEVTYYLDNAQPMANGQMPYWGAAACGYDVALGTRVSVPGVGLVTCTDREGQRGNPWRHVDVWGYRPGLGNDWRVVTVYPLG